MWFGTYMLMGRLTTRSTVGDKINHQGKTNIIIWKVRPMSTVNI